MRRAALCLFSTIALAATLPALAQDAAPATEQAAERTPPVVDPAALTPKTRADGDANVAPAALRDRDVDITEAVYTEAMIRVVARNSQLNDRAFVYRDFGRRERKPLGHDVDYPRLGRLCLNGR